MKKDTTTASSRCRGWDDSRLVDEPNQPQAGVVRGSDGKQTWLYMTSNNQYAPKTAAYVVALDKPAAKAAK